MLQSNLVNTYPLNAYPLNDTYPLNKIVVHLSRGVEVMLVQVSRRHRHEAIRGYARRPASAFPGKLDYVQIP